jgi:ketopantoate reductase
MIVRNTFSISKITRIMPLKKCLDEYMKFPRNKRMLLTIKHYSSMCQDIEEKKRANADHIKGENAFLGKKSDLPQLQPQTVIDLTHSKEEMR